MTHFDTINTLGTLAISGKSSLLLAILRMAPIVEGVIEIDGIDVASPLPAIP